MQVDLRPVSESVAVGIRIPRIGTVAFLTKVGKPVSVEIKASIINQWIESVQAFPKVGHSVLIGIKFLRVRTDRRSEVEKSK